MTKKTWAYTPHETYHVYLFIEDEVEYRIVRLLKGRGNMWECWVNNFKLYSHSSSINIALGKFQAKYKFLPNRIPPRTTREAKIRANNVDKEQHEIDIEKQVEINKGLRRDPDKQEIRRVVEWDFDKNCVGRELWVDQDNNEVPNPYGTHEPASAAPAELASETDPKPKADGSLWFDD